MSLRWRLTLLVLLATGLPALTGALVTRQLVQEILEVGLSPQVDAALEAGVRQARERYAAQREELEEVAVMMPGAAWSEVDSVQLRTLPDNVRVVLETAGGEPRVLQPGDPAAASPDPERGDGPPRILRVRKPLPGGDTLVLARPVDSQWREDAGRLAGTLQMVRGLRIQQERLARSYWLPYLVVFLGALVIGLAIALRLGRGITRPVQRLLGGTEAVAAGQWQVEVPVEGHDELGRLTDRFNAMVRTLDAQSRQLVDLEKMAGWREMARALAHEVKNPLTPIQLTVEEMRARYRGEDPEYRRLLDDCTRIVVEEVESLRAVVARFREFSRPVELQTRPTDLGQLVRDVAALQRDLQVTVDVRPGLAPVPVDPDRLRQVLMNLAENARQATAGLTEPRLAVTVGPEQDDAVIVLEDSGPGIPPNERDRVFEPYRSRQKGGLGLGLALVKGIVLAHGGRIDVDAGRWGGARFTIRLPRAGQPEEDR